MEQRAPTAVTSHNSNVLTTVAGDTAPTVAENAYLPPLLPRPVRIRVVAKATAIVCDVNLDELLSTDRRRTVARARQLAAYLAHHWSQRSTSLIGKYLGNRDHSTIMHAIKTTTQRLHDVEAEALHALILRIHEHLVREMKEWLPSPEEVFEGDEQGEQIHCTA